MGELENSEAAVLFFIICLPEATQVSAAIAAQKEGNICVSNITLITVVMSNTVLEILQVILSGTHL